MKRKPDHYNLFKKDACVINNDKCISILDIDHIKTFASGGLDIPENCMTLCRVHHQEKGSKGVIHMAEKYATYKKWLLFFGWELCPIRKKWIYTWE